MRAKLVNEIKKEINKSGLSAIGVGSIAHFPAYNKTKLSYHHVYNILNTYDKIISGKDSFRDKNIRKFLKSINKTPEDALWINEGWLFNQLDNYPETHEFDSMWKDNINSANKLPPEDDFVVMYYNDDLKMGRYIEIDYNEDTEEAFYFLFFR